MLPTYEAQTVHKASFCIPTEPSLRTTYPKEKGGLGQSYMFVQFAHPTTRPVVLAAELKSRDRPAIAQSNAKQTTVIGQRWPSGKSPGFA